MERKDDQTVPLTLKRFMNGCSAFSSIKEISPRLGVSYPGAEIIKSRFASELRDLIPEWLCWSAGANLFSEVHHSIDQKSATEGIGRHMVKCAFAKPIAEVRVQLDSNLLERHSTFLRGDLERASSSS